MPYIDARTLTVPEQESLVKWLRDQGLDPMEIDGERFAVHKGRISGSKFLFTPDGQPLWRKDGVLRIPFNVKQTIPLPEELKNAAL